jgi:hypothetical protein
MNAQTLVPMLAAFYLGWVVSEIRWIGRMRRLRSLLGLHAARLNYGAEGTMSATQDPLNLQQQQAVQAMTAPSHETLEVSRS